ncbi:THO complex subunit 6 isoform X2 [Anoplophora glabripennis]|uniref:THO complex subunit 6 isoform X2 n=1 Tax=Anoplophora glabripennis TaxID=217634 RepID=UPI0008750218|nr:THO complex subunit 6 isoform X2 [Anoplophora glabripennis]
MWKLPYYSLSKIVHPENNLSKEELTPKNRFTVKDGLPINSLLTTQSHLIVGGVGEIFAYQWKSVKTSKNVQPVWSIDIPGQKGIFDKTDVNCLLYNEDTGHVYAGCGDNNIYVFEIESRKLLKTLSKHKDFIHCLTINGNDIISGGEDGLVNIWDLRTYKVSNKIEPHLNDKVVRAEIGHWIGAVSSNEDYVLCGGGPRLSLWHCRFLSNSTIFPIDDKGIHVAEIFNDKILAGGRSRLFYQMTFIGDIISKIPTSAVTTYSAIHQEEPFQLLSIAGSSPKIDICNNFMYKNQQLSLY